MATKSGPADRKTKTKPRENDRMYAEFEDSQLWNVVSSAIDDLVENSDIKETTTRRYIVGYLCKKITGALLDGGFRLEDGKRTNG